MDRNNLLIVGSIISVIIVLISIGIFISSNSTSADNSTVISNPIINSAEEFLAFDNSTPEATAISIARLNEGAHGFDYNTVANVSLTSDGNYWIVNMQGIGYENCVVTVNAKTWMSKINVEWIDRTKNTWRSLDELKATYIADIQKDRIDSKVIRPSKLTIYNKEIWKVPVYKYNYEHNEWEQAEYVYVDIATGKSKNTWDKFNKAAGTDGWLTLKEVEDIINKMYDWGPIPFKNALRDLYP